jgi:hypothetical protein
MTRTKWAEWLTPFTAGMAIALLVVAVVVQPAWANNPQCSACMNYWTSTCINGKVAQCAGYTGQMRYQCCYNYATTECSKTVPGKSYKEPCPGDPGEPYYNDCTSLYCAILVDCIDKDGPYKGGTCSNICNVCDSNYNSCNTHTYYPEKQGVSNICTYYCGCGNL